MIAALFVQSGGCYFGLHGVDPWDEAATPPEFRDLLIKMARSVPAMVTA